MTFVRCHGRSIALLLMALPAMCARAEVVNADLRALAAEQFVSPVQFAVVVEHPLSTSTSGQWMQEDHQWTWTHSITVPGARSVAIRSQPLDLPAGAVLHVEDASGANTGDYRRDDLSPSRRFASRHVPGDTIKLTITTSETNRPEITFTQLLASPSQAALRKDGEDPHRCDMNYSCVKSPANELAGRATVAWSWDAGIGCTGTLIHVIGDTPTDITPLLLTADHCTKKPEGTSEGDPEREEAGDTMVLYFLREEICGQPLDGLFAIEGPTLFVDATPVYWYSDVVIFDLGELPPRETEAYFAGLNLLHPPRTDESEFNSAGANFAENIYQSDIGYVFGIHHSALVEKQYSDLGPGFLIEVEEYAPYTDRLQDPPTYALPGAYNMYTGKDRPGTMRGGGSGSGLFDSEQRLLGTLGAGGPESCDEREDENLSDGGTQHSYTSIYTAYEQDTLADLIDPLGTGERTYAGIAPDYPPHARLAASCNGLTCQFDASGSSDETGISAYAWAFGDGASTDGVLVEHRFGGAADYPVTLTVTDSSGQQEQVTETVTAEPVGGSSGSGAWSWLGLLLLLSGAGLRRMAWSVRWWIASLLLVPLSAQAEVVNADLRALAAEQFVSPVQFAVVVEHPLSTSTSGQWMQEDHQWTWTHSITVPGARSVAIRSQPLDLPAGAVLHVEDASGANTGDYRRDDLSPSRRFASRHVPGDTIKLTITTSETNRPEITFTQLLASPSQAALRKDGEDPHRCDMNYSCVKSPANELAGRATVAWSWDAGIGCTGTLIHVIGDTPTDITPLLLTADHCTKKPEGTSEGDPEREEAGDTMVLYFLREEICGQPLDGLFAIEGPTLFVDATPVYWYSDVVIFDLGELPPRETEAYFAGLNLLHPPRTDESEFNSAGANFAENIYQSDIGYVFGIHHSALVEKQYSDLGPGFLIEVEEYAPYTDRLQDPPTYALPGAYNMYTGKDRPGTMRGGGSGSGLFDSEQRLLGTLGAGGPESCDEREDENLSDGGTQHSYTSIYTAYEQDTLADLIDPLGTGERTYAGIAPDYPPHARLAASCNGLTCQFDASGSSDETGISAYAWAFGDGASTDGVLVEHRFGGAADYPVTLTVTDSSGQQEQVTETVTAEPVGGSSGSGAWSLTSLLLLIPAGMLRRKSQTPYS